MMLTQLLFLCHQGHTINQHESVRLCALERRPILVGSKAAQQRGAATLGLYYNTIGGDAWGGET